MLAVSKLTPGQEAYYERSVAGGIDDYYAGRGESPGLWAGRGAGELGLEGVVGEGELGRLIRGQHPREERRLRRHPPVRTVMVERIDPGSGERRLEARELRPVAGYDLVFGPPKSVSLLHALGGEQVRLAVSQAHEAAWQAALSYLEEEACVTRRGAQGVVREHGCGFVAAAFQHRTSRAQEPHLHTHVVVGNIARSPDGQYRALDGEPILRGYRVAAGCLYQAQLRRELTRTLGVGWREPVKGMAEIEGVPEGVLRAFSTRRAQVVDYLALHGTEGFYAARVAALATRERKEELDLPRLREEWRARAAEHGLGREELRALRGRQRPRDLERHQLEQLFGVLFGPEGLTEKQSTFSEAEFVAALAEAYQAGASAEQLRAHAKALLAGEAVQAVGEGSPGRPARYSTRELLALERRALALLERARPAEAPTVPAQAIDRALQQRGAPSHLSEEQRAMVRHVAESPDGVVCVVGQAGAGKTTALGAAARAFRAEGHPVLGAAPSGVAAEKLAEETGVASVTLHRVLGQMERRGGLPHGCVLFVDEAAMAETRVLTPVLEAVEQAGGKTILVGDPEQLPAVGAGGLFAAIVERLGAAELSENRRQPDELERRALTQLRAGEPEGYLALAAKQGRLLLADDPLELKARLLADWWRAARTDLTGNVMIAQRRRDVAELNTAARALMGQDGRLGPERLTSAGREFAPGDRIVCRQNNLALGLRNGTRGTVAAIDPHARSLVLRSDRGDTITMPEHYLGQLHHAYALTGHTTQGLTVERAFVLARDQGQLKEWGYVALSRAQKQTNVYLVASDRADDFHPAVGREPDRLARLASALARPGGERLALEQLESQLTPGRATGPSSSRARRFDEQRALLLEHRDAAERRLSEAERDLAALNWRQRRRHGPRLRSRIAFERRVLDHAEQRLTAFQRERQRAPARQRPLLASLGLERAQKREPQLEQAGHGLAL